MLPERRSRHTPLVALTLLLAAALAPPVRAGVNVWTPIGPNGGAVWTLAIDPATPTTLYAGTSGGVFKSRDGGASWTLASQGLGNALVVALTLDPRRPTHLFANTLLGSFRSSDAAATWQADATAPAGGILSLVADPRDPLTLYASSYPGSAWRSTDSGKTWKQQSDRLLFGLSLLADPAHPGTLFGSTQNGENVVFSTDGGATWSDRSAGLPELEDGGGGIQIALDPEVPTTLYAAIVTSYGEPAELFVSRDSGVHWQPTGVGGSPVATGPGGVVYTSTARSLDHGQTWSGIFPPVGDGLGLRVSPASGTRVYAYTQSGTYTSADGGISWQATFNGLAATGISTLAVRPALPTFVLAGFDHGIVRGRPSGQAWRPAAGSGAPASGPLRLLFDPADPAVAYAQYFQKILRSPDGGLTWEEAAPPPVNPGCSVGLRTLAVGPGALYAGVNLPTQSTCAQTCGIWKSVDQGQSWTCLSLRAPDVRSLAVAPSSAAVLYATETTKLWKSTDGGKSWALQNRGWQRLTTALDLVTVDPTRADTLYLTSAAGLLKSTDGARSFTTAGRGLPADTTISAVVIDPTTPTTLYAGLFFRGVFRSVDGGRRWFPQVGGLHGFSGALALDPLHPSTLYAGTPGNGVYTITFAP